MAVGENKKKEKIMIKKIENKKKKLIEMSQEEKKAVRGAGCGICVPSSPLNIADSKFHVSFANMPGGWPIC